MRIKINKHILLVLLAIALFISSTYTNNINSEAKSAYNTYMANYLKYFKAKKYKKAKTYIKKMKTTRDTSLKKMSKKQKKAYLNKVKQYRFDMFGADTDDGYLDGYFLADLNGDKNPELIIRHGHCEADFKTEIFTYKNGKAARVYSGFSCHISYYAYPGVGVVAVKAHAGYCIVNLISMKKGKIITKSYGSQLNDPDLCMPQNFLYNHINYKDSRQVDLSDLK